MAVKTFSAYTGLTASDTNTYLANAGLVYVKSDTITSGTSKEITAAFSSTYDHYRVIAANIRTSSANGLLLRLGTDNSAVYYYNGQYGLYSSATITGIAGAGATSMDTACTVTNGADSALIIDFFSPNLVRNTSVSVTGAQDPRTGGGANRSCGGYLNNTTQYTSFTFLTSGGATFSNCDILVYGYRKA